MVFGFRQREWIDEQWTLCTHYTNYFNGNQSNSVCKKRGITLTYFTVIFPSDLISNVHWPMLYASFAANIFIIFFHFFFFPYSVPLHLLFHSMFAVVNLISLSVCCFSFQHPYENSCTFCQWCTGMVLCGFTIVYFYNTLCDVWWNGTSWKRTTYIKNQSEANH